MQIKRNRETKAKYGRNNGTAINKETLIKAVNVIFQLKTK